MLVEATRRPDVITKQFLHRATENAGYVMLVIGYLISIFSASQLTLIGVLTFTGIQILYALVFWWVPGKVDRARWHLLLGIILLSILTFASGMTVFLGIYLDWLQYFVTVAVYFMLLSLPLALLASVVLYLGVGVTLYLTSGAIGFSQPWIFLLAGFVFVALFSGANKLLIAQQERTEVLLH